MTQRPANAVRALVAKRLNDLLDEHRVVVWYDAPGECLAVFDALERDGLVKVDARGSMLSARRQTDAAWSSIADPTAPPPRGPALLVYVPWARATSEEALQHEPFEVFARIGAAFGAAPAESIESLARQAMPSKAAEIDKLYAANERVTLSQLEALADRPGFPFLGKVLATEDPVEVAVRLLADSKGLSTMLGVAGVRADLARLLREAFGFQASGHPAALRSDLARWILFSEFAFDLKGELPAHTAAIPHAPAGFERSTYAVCDRLRGSDASREAYMALARDVEADLKLASIADEPGDWGDRDTFAAEDRSTLLWIQAECVGGRLSSARRALDLRKTSIWAREGDRAQVWQLATRCLELLEAAQGWSSRKVAASRPVKEHLAAYLSADDGLWRVDRCQRWMGRAEASCAEREAIDPLLEHARRVHSETAGEAQEAFLEAALRDGWPPDGPKQTDIYRRHVAPALQDGARVAYFLLDALRFEMGSDLAEMLKKLGEVGVEAAATVVPTTTSFGMAALLPGAETSFGCTMLDGDLVPTVAGKPTPDVNARKQCFSASLGDRYRDVRLDDLQTANEPKLRELIGRAGLLVVRSDDIDKAGEGANAPSARRFMSSILEDVTAVAQRLVRAGVLRMVFAADHGHVFLPEVAPGDVVREPPGDWPVAKRRCRVGRAAGSAVGVRVVRAAQLGIHGPVEDIAVAAGFRVFNAGSTYFHEGVSLQECLVPVVTLTARAAPAKQGTTLVSVTYKHDRFTQRVFIVKLKLATLEAPALDVRVAAVAPGSPRVVGRAADCEARDPVTGLIRLLVGIEEAVAIRIDDDFDGQEVEVRVSDASGAGVLMGSLKLKNAVMA